VITKCAKWFIAKWGSRPSRARRSGGHITAALLTGTCRALPLVTCPAPNRRPTPARKGRAG